MFRHVQKSHEDRYRLYCICLCMIFVLTCLRIAYLQAEIQACNIHVRVYLCRVRVNKCGLLRSVEHQIARLKIDTSESHNLFEFYL